MATFNFPFHSVGDEYPQSSFNVKFGRGYSFATAPRGPDQMIYHLSFEAMFFWYNTNDVLDQNIRSCLNAGALQTFYESVLMYTPFNYQHPRSGLVTVRFNKPLPQFKMMKDKVIQDGDSGARGHQVEPFALELILQPL